MKHRRAHHHENHERWLVSYADFITLLFAFFVVMFATAQKDKSKARLVAESVRDALEHGDLSTAISGIIRNHKVTPDGKGDSRISPDIPPPEKPVEKLPPVPSKDLEKTLADISQVLQKEVAEGKVTVKLDQRGLVVSMRELTFFASGEDTVNPASLPIIQKIAKVIDTLPNPVRLEGHTDALPIHNSRFRSNWELSAARSIALLEILRDQCGVPAEKLSVAGFAENAPVDTNDTPEGRSHNRRVDLVVLSAEAARGEPPSRNPAAAEPSR
ncbi:MAG TPA: flagellar motor protein MotB [Bryobacteraceae bacterium]|nr:flagellar motor protein MotB [Bryobacteraceae bacterium]